MLQASCLQKFITVQKTNMLKSPQPWNSQNKFKKDYSQSKRIIQSADLTKNSYPRTITSSHPNDNVIKTSAKSQDKQQKSHDADHNQVNSEAPTTTWRFWKYLKLANHQVIQ